MTTRKDRETECRGVPFRVECRNAASRTIGGLGAVFDSVSENLGGFVEVVAPSFFSRSQSDGWPNVVSFYNHRSEMLIDPKRGLDYEVDLPLSREDTLEAVQRGDCAFSSMSFICYEDRFSDWNGQVLRTLVSGRLIEVGPTPVPAYTATSAAMRNLATQVGAPVEDVLGYAEKDELRAFFSRSDMKLPVIGGKFKSGRRAVVEGKTTKQRQVELMAMAPGVPQPNTMAQRRAELTRMRYSPERKTVSEARAELTRMARPRRRGGRPT
jgi:uncharacterized protein